MDITKLNIDRLVRWLLPIRKRKPLIIALLKVCTNPVKLLYQELLTFRDEKLNQLLYNGQVIYLQRILNIRFNSGNPGIYITDAVEIDELVIYRRSENKQPVYIYTRAELDITDPAYDPDAVSTYMYTRAEYQSGYDFKVKVPAAITFDQNEMKAVIDSYRLAGKRYQIVTI
jgi:hypothetical protein